MQLRAFIGVTQPPSIEACDLDYGSLSRQKFLALQQRAPADTT
ncbi:MAG: hypothetical protein WA418_35135 [Bradyrhizobium sp.]